MKPTKREIGRRLEEKENDEGSSDGDGPVILVYDKPKGEAEEPVVVAGADKEAYTGGQE
jgi:hypothetical protein